MARRKPKPGSLKVLIKALSGMSQKVATETAKEAASEITDLGRKTFDASETAYGDRWEEGKEGQKVTLRKSGRLAEGIKYVAIGAKLRAVLGPKYAKYQVGKRPVFPRHGASLPLPYVQVLRERVAQAIKDEMGGVS